MAASKQASSYQSLHVLAASMWYHFSNSKGCSNHCLSHSNGSDAEKLSDPKLATPQFKHLQRRRLSCKQSCCRATTISQKTTKADERKFAHCQRKYAISFWMTSSNTLAARTTMNQLKRRDELLDGIIEIDKTWRPVSVTDSNLQPLTN